MSGSQEPLTGKNGDSYLFSAPEFPDLAHGIRQKMGNCPHFSPCH